MTSLPHVPTSPTDLEELFRQAPVFFAVLRGPEHTFERANEAYLQLVGHRAVVGKPLFEALPEIRDQGFDILLDGVKATKQPFVARGMRATLKRTAGGEDEEVFVDFIYQPLLDSAGEAVGVIAVGSDITLQVVAAREAESRAQALAAEIEAKRVLTDKLEASNARLADLNAELEASNDHLRDLNTELEEAKERAEEASDRVADVLGALSDAVSVFDFQWRWRYLNPAAAAVVTELGKNPEELVGRVLWDELPTLRGTQFETQTRRALEERRTLEYEEYLPELNRYYETRVVPSRDAITTFSRDVTQRRQAEADLRASEEQFRTAVNAIPTLAWIANADGWIFWYNDRWYEYTGTTPEQMEGWGWQSVHDPEVLPHVMERWKNSIATGVPFEMEFPLRSAAGEFRWFLTRVSPLYDAQGRITRWFGTNTDVHVQREAAEAALAANQAKADFLAAMSHETRQPINATLGFLEVMELEMYGPLTTEQREALTRIRLNQEQLRSVITDILSFARLEAGRVELGLGEVACAEVLAELPALVEPQTAARGVRLVVEPCDSRLTCIGDRNRIHQVCTNLATNAARATDAGGKITLRAFGSEGWVHIEVADTGRGIPAEKLELIFAPFVQLDRSLNRPGEGVGLGLAISRDLARAMGGDLFARSVVGEGSVFTLQLRRA